MMRALLRAGLLAASILTPLAVPSIASAQVRDTDGNPEAEQAGAEPSGNMIIVTARKREETLQNVPTSVSVATAETIARLGLDSVADIAKTTPGLVFDDSFGRSSNSPVIRGQANLLGDSGVAFFIDGIYYTGSIADYDVDTIERIEVVKGPQSALYGRNTYSGAINIISKMPGDNWEGRITADISEFDRYEVTAGIRGPISDGLGVGINGRYYDFGGEFINQFDGKPVGDQMSYSVSGVLNWDDGGPFTAALRGYFNRTDDGQPAIFAQGTQFNNVLPDDSALYGGGGRYFSGPIRPRPINTDYRRQFRDPDDVGIEGDTYNVSLRMEYELTDQFTLTSLSGFNDRTLTQLTDGDYGPNSFQTARFSRFPIGAPVGFGPRGPRFPFGFVGSTVDFSFANRQETRDYSQELRLSYLSDRFDVIVGGYYFNQDDDSFSIREVPDDAAARAAASFGQAIAIERAICTANPNCASVVPLFGPSVPNSRNESLLDIRNIAAFGAVELHVTPTINIGFEGRYAEERIRQSAFIFNQGSPRPASIDAEATFREFTPRVTVDWQPNPDTLIYGIYAEGQKPGGFNGSLAVRAVQNDPTLDIDVFDAEDNTSYELGIKNRFLDDALVVNLALFHNEIEGYQLTQNVSVPPNQVSVVRNAGNARINGAELEILARPSRNFAVTANYALADTKFTSGFDENQGVLNDVADDRLVNCSTGDQFPEIRGCQSLFGSIRGQRIPRAPVHRVFVDVDYRQPLGDGDWEFFAGGNVTFTSEAFVQVSNLASYGDSTVVDLRVGLGNGFYKIQGYVDNATDEDATAQGLRFADGDASFRRSFIGGLRPGRRFGVIVSAGF
ncbi:hypothetical protein A9995_14385 [Erythrobacter sp. QSSC1-22B]|nr:hypothetical protein A9995_14385 [Erythrobacter sp. QSSC1-22B]